MFSLQVEAIVEEINGLSHAARGQWHAQMANRFVQLYLVHAETLSDEQVLLFDRIFITLFRRADTSSLHRISEKLAPHVATPMQSAKMLASHPQIEIARPMLELAEGFSDADLREIATAAGPAHCLAIAGRREVDMKLCAALIERGDAAVIARLATNAGAYFSEMTFTTLIGHAAKDRRLAATIAARHDVPDELRSFFTMSMA